MKKNMKLFGIITSVAIAFTYLANVNLAKTTEIKTSASNEIATEVSAVKSILGYNQTDYYLAFKLKVNDYTFSYNNGNDYPLHTQSVDYTAVSNFVSGRITYNKTAVTATKSVACYFVYYGNAGTVAINFTNTLKDLAEGDKISIPKGTTFPSYAVMSGGNDNIYVTQNDVEFTYKEGSFRKVIETTSEESDVTKVSIVQGYDPATRFLLIELSNNDYKQITENNGNDYNLEACPQFYGDACNFGYKVLFNGTPIKAESRRCFLNYYGNIGTVGITFTNEGKNLKNGDVITINKDTTFPSYKFCKGTGNVIYTSTVDKVFTYKAGNFHSCTDNLSTFTYDETNHWQKCLICEKIFNQHTHNMVSGEMPATCELPGYKDSLYCEDCGYIEEAGTIIPALDHDFESSTYEYDETNHWRHCHRNCGEVEEAKPHTFGDDKKTCTVCGFVKNVVFITVVNGYVNGSESGEAVTDSIVTIIPNAPEDGKKFEGWYLEGTKVSSESTYSFTATKNETYEARYVVDPDWKKEEEEEKKKGCGGSLIGASSIIFATSLFGIFLTIKKKKS